MILRRIGQGAMVVGALLITYNVIHRLEEHTEARIVAARADERDRVTDGCWPQEGQTAVLISNGQSVRCRTYSTRSLSPGMAPMLISATVVELQP